MGKMPNQIMLITGPSGSGKTALASELAEQADWVPIEEDGYWLKNGWRNKSRTIQREETIQSQVLDDALRAYGEGKNVCVEFLLDKGAPNSLTAYVSALNRTSVPYSVIALKPSQKEILRRIIQRGRETDLESLDDTSARINSQLNYLHEDYIERLWIIDSPNIDIDELIDNIS